MTVPHPSRDELRAAAAELGLSLDDQTCDAYLELMAPNVEIYGELERMAGPPPPAAPERHWQRPDPADDPLNAWAVRTQIATTGEGPLAGRAVAVKDNVCLAGVPMSNGSTVLEGFVPDIDATIVTRLLDAGATVAGKTRCEYFCFSGGSHTGAGGAVRNPHKPTHSAGGSSSGSAALVGAGTVDLAIGGDQGGSIRIPSAFSGAYGMKATHGLVPYTGVMPIESTIDHVGPITANVSDNAALLDVLAGPDGLDPRQRDVVTHRYAAALTGDCQDVRVGVVREGFGLPVSEPEVDLAVRDAAASLATLGAKVGDVSVPMHTAGMAIWSAIALEGHVWQMLLGNGLGMNWRGRYATSLLEAMRGWQGRADEFSESLKLSMLVGNVFRRRYGGATYAKAQNLVPALQAAYDAALERYDVLVMPTVPMRATPLPPPEAPRELVIQRAFEMIPNTAPLDTSGHPAMSVPCALRGGLPVGMMVIGRHWDEPTIYRVAHAFEQAGDWTRR